MCKLIGKVLGFSAKYKAVLIKIRINKMSYNTKQERIKAKLNNISLSNISL